MPEITARPIDPNLTASISPSSSSNEPSVKITSASPNLSLSKSSRSMNEATNSIQKLSPGDKQPPVDSLKSSESLTQIKTQSTPEGSVLSNACVEVRKIGAKKDSFGNLELEVSNKRSFSIATMDKGLFIPSQGETKEKVVNVHQGKALKNNTVHSDWNRRRAPSDKHSLNISSIAKPSRRDGNGDLIGKLIQGKTTAQQMFVFKSKLQSETTFPRSGFHIEYTSEVFNSKGIRLESDVVEISPNSNDYAIITIEKYPANVTIDGVTAEKGSGDPVEAKWKISRDTQVAGDELKWNIDLI
ncbi:hypothetical protein [Vibrio campbellii]|nr:hypothetical protein [Vibrio campbellii]MBT0122124.1 hypothetical protein [Vibrio campbellii]MBT0137207.1 hypothetical protein [Vibrio campbellii]MBT0141883.1 hypothetical protein [Vibrio campbellii]MBT0146559.1 hypothetical protein [Vibrio campbellii]MBT0151212.1 hypothetical protein [Vibrio campbellii]